jgi:prepilin-type N-terminal cleavage/methylation domain-containing protein/prepilin-type processing-associated H-X9-DG protein
MTQLPLARRGFTLTELMVVLAIFGILLALLLPAVQYARAATARIQCANRLRQLAIALHSFHDAQQSFPPGIVRDTPTARTPNSTWLVAILPHVEESGLWQKTMRAYELDRSPFHNPPHDLIAHVLPVAQCPADGRVSVAQITRRDRLVALTSFLGVSGTDLHAEDGVLFADSQIGFRQIVDGASNTLLIGERPPSPDFFYGWWYCGVGQARTGSVTIVLGVREINTFGDNYGSCYGGPYFFTPGQIDQPCDRFHFWSLHQGGANFALCDGAVRFLPYSADALLPALATRNGGNAAEVP